MSSATSRKDLTRSQIDLVYGGDRSSGGYDGGSLEDNKSLSGVSIGSKSSSRGSEETSAPTDISLSKNNKGMWLNQANNYLQGLLHLCALLSLITN